MSWLIYKHTNLVTGKYYVGYTSKTMEARWQEHLRNAAYKTPLRFYNSIRHHGSDCWTHEVLQESIQTREEVRLAEKKWIAELDAMNPEKGYNMTRGGDGCGMLGKHCSPEHKENLRKLHFGKPKGMEARRKMSEAKRGANNPNYGKPRSDEVKERIRRGTSGERAPNAKLTEATKREIIARWANRDVVPVRQHHLAQEYGVTQSTISRLLTGKTWK